jgi:hypothetical protein
VRVFSDVIFTKQGKPGKIVDLEPSDGVLGYPIFLERLTVEGHLMIGTVDLRSQL